MTKESVQQNMDHAKHITAAETVLSFGEELANALTHGFGALAIAVASPFLLVASLDHGAAFIVGAAVFVATAVLLYLASTIYHALRPGRTKRFFQRIDHIAIFLLIAGTYTPFTLGRASRSMGLEPVRRHLGTGGSSALSSRAWAPWRSARCCDPTAFRSASTWRWAGSCFWRSGLSYATFRPQDSCSCSAAAWPTPSVRLSIATSESPTSIRSGICSCLPAPPFTSPRS